RRRRARAGRGGAAGRRAPHQAVQPQQAHRPHRGHAGRRASPAPRARGPPVSVWAAILAGGSGTRFWPLSTAERPKQLLPLAGDRPLLQQAVERLDGLVPPERILILTGPFLVDQVARAVPQIPRAQVLAEPRAASTSPARAALLRQRGALWNTGLFAWSVARFLGEAGAYARELKPGWPALAAGDITGFFGAVRPVAVDVAVLERTKRLAVVAGTFRWDDIGSWDALLRIRKPDAHGNVVVGNVTLADDVRRSVVWSDSEHLAVIGLEDM